MKKKHIPNIVISLIAIIVLSALFYVSKAVTGRQENKAASGSNTQENKAESDNSIQENQASGSSVQGNQASGSSAQGNKIESDSGAQEENLQEQPQEKKKIALTFDDGPDAEYTPQLLDGLAERGVKVTFFVIGKQAEEQPELMERIVKEGHLIGNHTYNHVDIRNMTESAAIKEIEKANEVIEKFTGEEPSFLRPPFGSGSNKLEKEMEMIQVLWTIDTMDWACKNEAKICNTVYKEIEENSIILMHDEYPATVRAALSIIDQLQKEGYEFVTVDEIILG